MAKDKKESPLTGPQKAISLLLTLGEDRAAKVVEHLGETEIRRLTETLATMGSVSSHQLRTLYLEFAAAQDEHALPIGSGTEMMRRIAGQVMGQEKADDILAKEITAPDPLLLLNRIDPQTLSGLLGKEHPQSLAALLAHVDVDKATSVLQYLPQDTQKDIVRRMAELEAIPKSTIEEAEKALRAELALVAEAKVAPIAGIKRAAELVSGLASEVSERLLEEIDEDNEDLCLAIKRSMFTFEDLINVDNRDMQTLLREVSSEQLKLGLKTASPDLKDHVLGAMSRRAAEMLLDDIDSMGPVKLSQVEEAQGQVVEVALKLQGEGKIAAIGGGGEEMV
ncbi:MAG: flagellar motor switch protein FliG [Myxococcales bacterium FL481]|nr:MAG: flagellar motor switch protein FliG [Myxococcales bacterium FL481]